MASLKLESILSFTAIAVIVGGCLHVLAPFMSSLLWAIIVTFSTWGLYERLLGGLGGRKTLAALVMTFALGAVLVVPLLVVAMTLGDNLRNLANAVRHVLDSGLPAAPPWLARLPAVGTSLQEYWTSLEQPDGRTGAEVMAWLESRSTPISQWLLRRGMDFGQAMLQLTLVVMVAFFLYRDGAEAANRLRAGMERLAGQRAHTLVDLAGRTVKGVVYGLLGTAILQGLLAAIGFLVAGVPGPLFLGMLVSAVSFIPFGPPLVWFPASLWLLHEGQVAWAGFMFLWGLLVVSTIDNFVRPILISQGSALPFVLVLLGVIGGLLAFGFVGLFLGPTLLAVGYAMLREWTRPQGPTPRA
jgi:predicted PurR-regulated permease PerM